MSRVNDDNTNDNKVKYTIPRIIKIITFFIVFEAYTIFYIVLYLKSGAQYNSWFTVFIDIVFPALLTQLSAVMITLNNKIIKTWSIAYLVALLIHLVWCCLMSIGDILSLSDINLSNIMVLDIFAIFTSVISRFLVATCNKI